MSLRRHICSAEQPARQLPRLFPTLLQAVTGGLSLPAFDLSLPKTPAGWTYSVFALLYLATAAGCYAPEAMFQVGWGLGLCWSLCCL